MPLAVRALLVALVIALVLVLLAVGALADPWPPDVTSPLPLP